MKKILVLLLIPMACEAQLSARKYVTLGVGFSATLYKSTGFDRFTEEYNLVNGPNLASRLDGFDGAEGIRWEAGYRRVGRWGLALLAGLQQYLRKDIAAFANGESRTLELKMRSLYVEYEMGRAWNKLFVNGVCAFFFNRGLTLESAYNVPIPSDAANKVLNGTYKTDKSFAADLGIAVGIHKEPMFIAAKITYPAYTGGSSSVFQDRSAEKAASGFAVFPNEYVNYLRGDNYKGVASNIDGLKISITAAFAIRVK